MDIVLQIASGIGLTLTITGLSLGIGAVLGIPLAVARQSKWVPLGLVATGAIDLIRSIPPITWLFLIFFGLPQFALRMDSMTAAVFGFSVIASAYMAEVYRSGLLSIAKGQWEAATALGLGARATAVSIITPQAFRVALPGMAAYAIALLKDSALASTIGVQEITYQASLASSTNNNGLLAFGIAGVLYIGISVPLALLSRRVDRAMRMKLEMAR